MTTVHVSNVSHATTESELSSFFSFCGKITSLTLTPESGEPQAPKSATITFERDSAAKTAALLDGTPLNNSPLRVSLAHSLDDIAGSPSPAGDRTPGAIHQEDKPRAAIFAEYLAHGYEIGDNVLAKAIEVDQKQGITAKFSNLLTNTLKTLEDKTHVTQRAQAVDSQYNITDKAFGATSILSRYFEKALDTVPGRKVRDFYFKGEKEVMEIHQEALRLKELNKERKRQSGTFGESADGKPFEEGGKQTCSCAGNEGACKCEPGKCACADCGVGKTAEEKAGPKGQFEHATTDIKDAAQDFTYTKQ